MQVTDITSPGFTRPRFFKYSIVGSNGKGATITHYGNCFQIKYSSNGAVKHFAKYHEAIQHLQAQGY